MYEAGMHGRDYRLRRFLNWFPLGLAYAFFYMGRYNLTVSKTALGELMTKADFGEIFAIGAWVYGLSFLLSGPAVDKYGGRRMMLIGTAGTIVINALMGLVLFGITNWGWELPIFWSFVVLYACNMHFQSYGAVAIVTVKAPWFHVRERGTFSTIFGVMISLGIYFAFDWGYALVDATRGAVPEEIGNVGLAMQFLLGSGGTGVDQNWWIFFFPAIVLGALWLAMFLWLRNTPGEAGFKDFDTGEESVSRTGEAIPVFRLFKRILMHPVLLVVCGIEFCSGILRNGVMHWYPFFAKEIGFQRDFYVTANWGFCLLLAGVVGAYLTGRVSDRYFQSRRGPMAAVLYGMMIVACLVLAFALESPELWFMGIAVLVISMAVIGVHGILSGTATADFGGRNTGAAVGIVDGMVYLGTGIQSLVIGLMVPVGDAAKDPANWIAWPIFLIPFAIIGMLLSFKIWNAKPKQKSKERFHPTEIPELGEEGAPAEA